jgi:hypothetical protein
MENFRTRNHSPVALPSPKQTGRSAMEVEDYKVDLPHALSLELTIDPDLGKNAAFATLAEWRIA